MSTKTESTQTELSIHPGILVRPRTRASNSDNICGCGRVQRVDGNCAVVQGAGAGGGEAVVSVSRIAPLLAGSLFRKVSLALGQAG